MGFQNISLLKTEAMKRRLNQQGHWSHGPEDVGRESSQLQLRAPQSRMESHFQENRSRRHGQDDGDQKRLELRVQMCSQALGRQTRLQIHGKRINFRSHQLVTCTLLFCL